MPFDGVTTTQADGLSGAARGADGEFHVAGRLGVTIGGAAVGILAGGAAAMALGRVEPLFSLAGVAAVCALAALIAGRSMLECAARRQKNAATLIGLHILALIAWPMLIQAAPNYAMFFSYAALGTLLAVAASLRLSDKAVSRLGTHSLLFGLALGYQSLAAIMS